MAAHVFCGDVVIKDRLIVSKVAGAETVDLPDAINAVDNLANTYITLSKTNFTFTPDNGHDNTGLEVHYGLKDGGIWFDTFVLSTIQNPQFSIGFNIRGLLDSLQNPPYKITGTIYSSEVECGNIVLNANDCYMFELDKEYSNTTDGQATVNSGSSVIYKYLEKFVCLVSSASNATATQKISIRIDYDIAVSNGKWRIRISALTIYMPNDPYLFSDSTEISVNLRSPGYNTSLMDQVATEESVKTQDLSAIGGKYMGTDANADNSSNLYPLVIL